jgi:hypothetical protein
MDAANLVDSSAALGRGKCLLHTGDGQWCRKAVPWEQPLGRPHHPPAKKTKGKKLSTSGQMLKLSFFGSG